MIIPSNCQNEPHEIKLFMISHLLRQLYIQIQNIYDLFVGRYKEHLWKISIITKPDACCHISLNYSLTLCNSYGVEYQIIW